MDNLTAKRIRKSRAVRLVEVKDVLKAHLRKAARNNKEMDARDLWDAISIGADPREVTMRLFYDALARLVDEGVVTSRDIKEDQKSKSTLYSLAG